MTPLCYWCARREATTTLDGQVSCMRCATPVPEPEPVATYAMRVWRAVKFNPGATCSDVMNVLGCCDTEGGAISQHLRRLVRIKSIEAIGSGPGRMFYATGKAPVRQFLTYPDDNYFIRPDVLPPEERKEGGCRCGVGLLPEWGDLCPECRDYFNRQPGAQFSKYRDPNILATRRRREKLMAQGLCINNGSHGKSYQGGRCFPCWEKNAKGSKARRDAGKKAA